jgi:hypothetical protein
MGSVNITLRSIVVSFGNIIKGDTVIVDRGPIGHRREISTDPTNGECDKSKPFDRADGEPLDVTEGDGECENLSVFDVQVNVHHVGGKLVVEMLVQNC